MSRLMPCLTSPVRMPTDRILFRLQRFVRGLVNCCLGEKISSGQMTQFWGQLLKDAERRIVRASHCDLNIGPTLLSFSRSANEPGCHSAGSSGR